MKIPFLAKRARAEAGLQPRSYGCRTWAALTFVIAAAAPLAVPVNAEDVYGTFYAHVVYVDGWNGYTFPGITKTLITTSGTVLIPIGETKANTTLQDIEV